MGIESGFVVAKSTAIAAAGSKDQTLKEVYLMRLSCTNSKPVELDKSFFVTIFVLVIQHGFSLLNFC